MLSFVVFDRPAGAAYPIGDGGPASWEPAIPFCGVPLTMGGGAHLDHDVNLHLRGSALAFRDAAAWFSRAPLAKCGAALRNRDAVPANCDSPQRNCGASLGNCGAPLANCDSPQGKCTSHIRWGGAEFRWGAVQTENSAPQ